MNLASGIQFTFALNNDKVNKKTRRRLRLWRVKWGCPGIDGKVTASSSFAPEPMVLSGYIPGIEGGRMALIALGESLVKLLLLCVTVSAPVVKAAGPNHVLRNEPCS